MFIALRLGPHWSMLLLLILINRTLTDIRPYLPISATTISIFSPNCTTKISWSAFSMSLMYINQAYLSFIVTEKKTQMYPALNKKHTSY